MTFTPVKSAPLPPPTTFDPWERTTRQTRERGLAAFAACRHAAARRAPWTRCSYPQRWSMRIEILRRAVGEQLLARSYPSTPFRARLPHIAATIAEWGIYVRQYSFKSVAQADWMKLVASDCREVFLVIKDWPGIGKPPEGPQYEKTARYPVAAAHVETSLADLDEILGRVHRFMFDNQGNV